jgi:hypothetical protein
MRLNILLIGIALCLLLLILPAAASDYTLGVFGNANEDDTINMQDVTYTELIILGYNDATELADAKYDGEIDILDMTQIALIILEREAELTVKDAIDRIVTIGQPTERVVTLFPAATEMVYAFEPGDMVGVDDRAHTDHRFDHLTAVGDGCNPDYTAIAGLNPDLVITVMHDGHVSLYTLTALFGSVICIRVDLPDDPKDNIGEAFGLLGYIVHETDKIEDLLDDCSNDDGAVEYSVSTIEDYSDSILGDLCDGQAAYNALENTLHDDAGWTEKFYEVNDSVDEPDFGTSNSGYQGLDGADFHYHLGHGIDNSGTEVCLHDWWPWNNAAVRASDVADKWDEDNEWVILQSCHILADHDDWKHALKHSHALMGFESGSYSDAALVNNFMANAVGNDAMTVYDAYRAATEDAFGSDVTAVVIFDTDGQFYNDHLWGEGVVMPDEYLDDDYWKYDSWNCLD